MLNTNYENKITDLIILINQICVDNRVDFLKYVLYHDKFPTEFIDTTDWNTILIQIYHYNNQYTNYKHYQKSKLYNIILEFIFLKRNIPFLLKTLCEETICNIIRLPDCYNILEIVFDNISLDKYDYEHQIDTEKLLISILKYGNINTFKLLQSKTNIYNLISPDDFINLVLYNRNKSFIKNSLEYFKNLNELEYIHIDFEFLLIKEI